MIKYIGQHIVDFIARFRSDVYLEDVADPGSDTDKFLVVDANNKVGYRTGAEVLSDIGASSEATDLEFNGSTANGVLTYGGVAQIDVEQYLTFDGSELNGGSGSQIKGFEEIGDINTELFGNKVELSSAGGGNNPYIELVSSNADSSAPRITFQKTATGADDDDLGEIKFRGDDEGNGVHDYAIILAEIADATPGEEAGRLSFKVAEFDGTITTGLTINGDTNANGEVDVTIGSGQASSTNVIGMLHSYGFDVINVPAAGRSAVDIFNYDVDEIALDIDASNTTGNIIDVNAAALTTGDALFIDCNSLTTGSCISIDVDDGVADDGAVFNMINLDYDKSANNTSGNKIVKGLNINMDDNATGNSATTLLTGVDIDMDADGTGGVMSLTGSSVNVEGGDAFTGNTGMIGYRSRVDDTGVDFLAQSRDQLLDYFTISTVANGATTLTTENNGGTAAHFEIAADGNITLDAAGDIALEAGGGDVTGDAADYTFTSSVSSHPSLTLNNTTSDATGPFFTFVNSDTGANDHVIGSIMFRGTNDNDEAIQYGLIQSKISAAGDGTEGGKLLFDVASHNGTSTTGLTIEDGNTSGEVDVTIGAGSSAAVVSSGTFKASGGTITSAGSGTTTGGRILIQEGTDNGTNYVGFIAPAAIGSNIAWTLPAADGNASEFLQTNGSGVLTWAAAGGSVSVTDSTTDSDFPVVFCNGDTLHDDSGSFTYNPSDQTLKLVSSTSLQPDLLLQNDNADASPSTIAFKKSANGSDDDEIGIIYFLGDDDGGTQTTYATVKGGIKNAADGNENGQFEIIVSNNASNVVGLKIEADSTTAGEVDVTLGAGTASTTTVTGDLTVTSKASIPKRKFGLPSDGAGNHDGDVVYIGTGSTVVGKIYYYKSDGSWGLTNSDDPSTATGWLAVALGTDPDVDGMLLRGTIDLAENIVGTEALGSIIYLDKATAGAATTAAPTATGDIVRVIGYALTTGDANKIWFSPDNTWVEHV